MKKIKLTVVILLLTLNVSCAAFTRHNDPVERDEFLNKLPVLNQEILGELKYSNDQDLTKLRIGNYMELLGKADLTDDYKKVVYFIKHYTPERKLILQRDTFFICLRSKSHAFITCDDAATPCADKVKVYTGESMPGLDDFYADFISGVGRTKCGD